MAPPVPLHIADSQCVHAHSSAAAVPGPVAAEDTLVFAVEAFLTLQNSPGYVNIFCCLDSPPDWCKQVLQQLELLLA